MMLFHFARYSVLRIAPGCPAIRNRKWIVGVVCVDEMASFFWCAPIYHFSVTAHFMLVAAFGWSTVTDQQTLIVHIVHTIFNLNTFTVNDNN